MGKRLFFHSWVTNSKLKNRKFHFEILTQSWKFKASFGVTNLKFKLYFQVANLYFKNIKLHFKLLTWSCLIWEAQSHLRVIKRKPLYILYHPPNPTSSYVYIIIRIFKLLENVELKVKFTVSMCRTHGLSN